MSRELQPLAARDGTVGAIAKAALEGVEQLKDSTLALLANLASRPDLALAVSVPYLKLCGYVVSGWLMAKAAVIAAAGLDGSDHDFYAAKLQTARFYAEQMLPNALSLARLVQRGAASVVESDSELI